MIKIEAYNNWELQELYKIIEKYITLTKQNIELYESYSSVNASQHMGIMKAELSLSDLAIQKSQIKAKISASYAKLSYLTTLNVDSLELELQMSEKPNYASYDEKLINNPALKIKTKELQKEQKKVEVAELNKYPDINLIAGYSYRENFDDYLNIGVALSLPIYGTEDTKEEELRAKTLEVSSDRRDTTLAVQSELKTYFAQMLSSYEVYHIIEDDALPQVAHMFDISSSSIDTGGDLFKYIDVLFDKLKLEKKSIQAVSSYKKSEAKYLNY